MITFYEVVKTNDRGWVEYAESVAQDSPDPSTKTGAVVVVGGSAIIGEGFNRLPFGVHSVPERFLRPEKYLWTEHSERVALGACARYGRRTSGATLYSNWWPCAECSRGIIEAGIVRVVGVKTDTTHPKYGHEFEVSLQMLREAGVECVFIGERLQVQK